MAENKKVFLAIQKEMQKVTKNAKGYNYKYADLPKVWESIEKVLDRNEVAVTSSISDDKVRTDIIKDGEIVATSEIALSYAKNSTPQEIGSAITYFRRYNLMLLFNIIVEDDDAQKAQKTAVSSQDAKVSNDEIMM